MRAHPTADDDLQRYIDWKKILKKDNHSMFSSARKGHREILRLWDGALAILASDNRDHHQSLAKDLVDDGLDGHEFILATICMDDTGATPFISYAEPFLKVITHPSLLDCRSVDYFVGTMYTSFSGTNGDRAISFLLHVCQGLMDSCKHTSDNRTSITPDMTHFLLQALYELLRRARRAQFHDDLPALLDLLYKLIHGMTKACHKADLDAFDSRIATMRRLVTSANRSLVMDGACEENFHRTGPVQSSFPMEMGIPGGRHDNDLAEISQIQILPTYREIISENSEYLPSTNFVQPHFLEDPVLRYIDSTFRLLRHDIFGSVKDVLRDLLEQDDPTCTPYLSNKDIRAHLYMGSQVRQIFINGKNELEATISFSTPSQLRNKPPFEQCRW